MIDALLKEIALQKDYLSGETIETIYFGGGTPSLLEADDIAEIIDRIQQFHTLSSHPEITLEANPDDLNAVKIRALRQTPVNRFSIGVQSFYDEDLSWMNRSHNAEEAESAIKRTQDAGFDNITADLIYGYPLLSDQKWLSNIEKLVNIAVAHISCYSLTVETGTALHSFIQHGKQKPLNDSQSAAQFILLMQKLNAAGFIHYEISNFALPGRESKHNSNYWKGNKYLGIGPSAHSFNGISRQWNVANNAKYLLAIQTDTIPYSEEVLTINNRFNEYIMTSLRTIWGADMSFIQSAFGEHHLNALKLKLAEMAPKNWLEIKDEKVTLTQDGKLFADQIASEFFITDDE